MEVNASGVRAASVWRPRYASCSLFFSKDQGCCKVTHGDTWRDRRAALEAAQQGVIGADAAYHTHFLRKPFVSWRAAAHAIRRRADTLNLCVARLRHREAALAFHSWRSVAAELHRQRDVVEGSLRRLIHRSSTALPWATLVLDKCLS